MTDVVPVGFADLIRARLYRDYIGEMEQASGISRETQNGPIPSPVTHYGRTGAAWLLAALR